jgi:hypothetical protein
MKPIEYYSNRTITYPSKHDFGKVFVYRAGKTVYEGDLKDWPTVKDKYGVGYAVEKLLDLEAWRAARIAYDAELKRRNEEFKADLFEEHSVTGHPKAEKAFQLAWRYGHSSGLGEIANYFDDLVELIKD